MGEDTVSGLMFADGFVGMSETPEGLQERIEKTPERSGSMLCVTNIKVNSANFSWKWGEDDLPIVDQYT